VKILAALGGGLVRHEPLYDLRIIRRTILLPPDLKRKLRGEIKCDFPHMALATLIGQFLIGGAFSVSQKRRDYKIFRNKKQPILERLEGFDEIWVFCHRKPGAGWRMCGRFLEKDVFVLLDILDKRDIGNNYAPVASNIASQWSHFLPTEAPLSATWISGYLSGSHYDVDQEKQI
jgi:hypothetical protein